MSDWNLTTNCRGCGAVLPEPFLDLGETPLANSYCAVASDASEEKSFPLALAYCEQCHLVQLNYTVPPEQLFSEYLYFSSFSQSFLKHAADMADSLSRRFELGPQSKVLEIASNDGYLLQYFKSRNIEVLGIEPAKNIAAHAQSQGIATLNCFFGAASAPTIRERFGLADIIIGNNVFAHVPETNAFLSSIYACLKPGGTVILEFPYAIDLIRHREFDTIYHEHIFYFSLSAVKLLAERARLSLDDVEHQSVHGGSLRVFLGKQTAGQPSAAVDRMLASERDAGATTADFYKKFSADVVTLRQQFAGLLSDLKARGKRIAAYGAPAKGNTLLNYCKVGADTIEFTVDRSPHKQGLLLPGSRIPILSPEELNLRRPDYAVILPWNIKDEIVAQQTEYVHAGGQFICPIPSPAILPGASEEFARQ